MRTNFDIDALRAVLAGIEQKSFSRAANELGLSQPAISRQLKKLELQAGAPLFTRQGRGLVPTEAGEALADYARQIIALNDEAARAVGAAVEPETIRLGLPQDFFDDVMPAATRAFTELHPDVHVTVRAGNNHIIGDEIDAGRLDVAIAFFPSGSGQKGKALCKLPLKWLAHDGFSESPATAVLPLVLFNHPCLFRQMALSALDQSGARWHAALTTPSLQAVWAALRAHFGVGVRINHNRPPDIVDVSDWPSLPELHDVELRLLTASHLSGAASTMLDILAETTVGLIDAADRRRG
ncbi:MAG: LysR family transcriptional regulator [Rhizobiales bacterium]|nr:LysR family transcriptional regulator [Hyphomicrobiales bacterium]MBO6699957.1 LysR family transcriptional regulator [Hyphomicrobiales bacterium]MBO6737878.1 LysR family transcriptional regulator [Hyphomicrobiales bacterium]MBO6913065.1 LysR family transcriptional regulator [Hyphomicrobiales bacterium]MBO6956653.1 LysR family transcriptional regulator [Hyphomicrobiales bacterium]